MSDCISIEQSEQDKSFDKTSLNTLFQEQEVDSRRLADLVKGKKNARNDFRTPENQYTPEAVSGNYGVVAGGRLLVFDVDIYGEEEISSEILEFLHDHPTFTIQTPHGGLHLYYCVPEDTAERIKEVLGCYNPEPGGVEVNSRDSYVVGPGSELEDCTKDWCNDCSQPGEGKYEVIANTSLREIPIEEFLELAEEVQEESNPDVKGISEAEINHEEVDGIVVTEVNAVINQYYYDDKTTERAENWLHKMMWGDYQQLGFDSEDHYRSEAEVAFFSRLYGILRKYTEMGMNDSVEATSTYLTHCCNERPWTDGGDARKWGYRKNGYRSNVANHAVKTFDPEIWERAQQKRKEWVKDDDYSSLTYRYALQAVEELTNPDYGEYPTRKEVVARAQEEDPSRSEESHRKALSRLQKNQGEVKMAYLGGNDYVYLPAEMPDPEEAEWVKIEDQKIEPEEEKASLDPNPLSKDNQPAFLRFEKCSNTLVGNAEEEDRGENITT